MEGRKGTGGGEGSGGEENAKVIRVQRVRPRPHLTLQAGLAKFVQLRLVLLEQILHGVSSAPQHGRHKVLREVNNESHLQATAQHDARGRATSR
jgi:hypothetical protein